MKQTDDKHESVDLAGEYVLGTLQGEEREDFKRRSQRDAALQQEITDWERRLAPMLELAEPIQPPSAVWRKIQQQIDPQPVAEKTGFWESLHFWRTLGLVTAGLVLGLSLSLFGLKQETGDLERLMVVMTQQSQPGWVIGTQKGDSMLRVNAVQPGQIQAGKVCQLWMETEEGILLPVGILPHDGKMKMPLPADLQQSNRFKVSIESALLGPADKPSDEIIFEGKMTTI